MLLELAVALAVMSLGLALLLPLVPARTTPTRLLALVTTAAALLRDARSAALLEARPVGAVFDANRRQLSAGGATLAIPQDVELSVVAGGNCPAGDARSAILFRPDGTNCGGALRFVQGARTLRARVDWASGRIDVVEGG